MKVTKQNISFIICSINTNMYNVKYMYMQALCIADVLFNMLLFLQPMK